MAGTPTHAAEIHTAARNSLFLSLAAGVIVAVPRLHALDGVPAPLALPLGRGAFYVIMLALMTPGFLLAVGTQLFWSYLGLSASIWHTALGANVIWGIPFGFLVMLAVWNRYDPRVEEAARDLGADQKRTFREVTLPLVWTGLFGCFLFGFTLTWNDYDRSVLFQTRATDSLPLEIGGHHLHGRRQARSLRARHGDDALLAARDRPAARRSRRSGCRFRGGKTQRVEEELGLADEISADAAARR